MNRFLRYSQEKGRKIRMMLMLNGQLAQKTALVLSYASGSSPLPCPFPIFSAATTPGAIRARNDAASRRLPQKRQKRGRNNVP